MVSRKRARTKTQATSFRVVNTQKQVKPKPGVLVLARNLWDDFGYRSSFRLFLPRGREHRLIGTWKILDGTQKGVRTTELPRTFTQLPSEFVSLGQELTTYESLSRLPRKTALAILAGLRDVVFEAPRDLEEIDGFNASMIRFAKASEALRTGRRVLARAKLVGQSRVRDVRGDDLAVHVSAQLEGFTGRHELVLPFHRSSGEFGLRRVVVMVGPNGSGKTQLLAALARGLSGLSSRTIILNPPKPFPHVVAVSYGAFDHFTHPRINGAAISYIYCGLRVAAKSAKRTPIILDLEGALKRGALDILKVVRSERRAVWKEALRAVGMLDLVTAGGRGIAAVSNFLRQRLSAGQKVVALTLTSLALHLQPGALVLHDEPETHLHPALLAALMRALHGMLEDLDCYALVATHSLIPLQETPSRNVLILDRYEEGVVNVHQPAEQCFASTLDEISRTAFRTQPSDENFRSVLAALRTKFDTARIRVLLGGELGLGTELQLASLE